LQFVRKRPAADYPLGGGRRGPVFLFLFLLLFHGFLFHGAVPQRDSVLQASPSTQNFTVVDLSLRFGAVGHDRIMLAKKL
jgi:hypothetical protein